MGIQYFYNFCVSELDDTDLTGDILSAVRRSYFATFEKIRDKITYDSEGVSMRYDYCIERDKPLRWTVKDPQGNTLQEVLNAAEGRYYLCFYRDGKLFKRLLFSKLHTLLKAEYMDDSGAVCCSVEPRKVQGGLCLLYTDNRLSEPLVLSAAPGISDKTVAQTLYDSFTDVTVTASTNEGVVRFLSDEQLGKFRAVEQELLAQLAGKSETSFVDDAPLFERINAKDFNMKRNLSASLDITQARDFGESSAGEEPETVPAPEMQPTETAAASEESAVAAEETDAAAQETAAAEEAAAPEKPEAPESEQEETSEEPAAAAKPDKLIMADGAVYSYYGELDALGNRSGYGRTLTDLGRTAYEGMYRSDKRSGKGAYFYKDGSLCYSGDWSENVRHGVGIGVSARDGSMHIGRWVNNKPEGNGVRMTAGGEIVFVCKELSDGGTVLMNYTDEDAVVIAKYDKNGSKLSEKTVSLKD